MLIISPVGAVQNMLQAGMIIAGWDPTEGGAVYALPLGGTLLKVPFSIGEQWNICIVHLQLLLKP